MDERAKIKRLELLEEKCRDGGIPFTIQRRAVLRAVLDLDNHPTADQVYDTAADRLPGISRTTVYRTLETLVNLNVITKVCHPGSAIRYDRRIENHHHLVCLRCNEVTDFKSSSLRAGPVPDTSRMGFTVCDLSVQVRGICRDCNEEGES